MHWHAGHRDRCPVGCPAARERQAQQARAALGVVIEHLVEVAHAVEQQQRPRLGLEAKVLLHHRRVRSHRSIFKGRLKFIF